VHLSDRRQGLLGRLGLQREAFGPGVEPSRDAPGSMVRPVDGELILLLDEAAASHLPVTG